MKTNRKTAKNNFGTTIKTVTDEKDPKIKGGEEYQL